LYDLNQAFLEETLDTSRPLISELVSLSDLRAEYENESGMFVQQIDWLRDNGYSSLRRTRGDGDCFYRATAYAYVEQLLNAPDRAMAVGRALSLLETLPSLLESVGFQKLAFEDFYDTLYSLVQNIVTPNNEGLLNSERLLTTFQAPEISNSIVMFLRMIASAQIRMAPPDVFSPFLIHPETNLLIEAQHFCEQIVEVCGKEADHVQMAALCQGLQINLDVAYLTAQSRDGSVDFVEIRSGNVDDIPLVLLYRPGHYDILVGSAANVLHNTS